VEIRSPKHNERRDSLDKERKGWWARVGSMQSEKKKQFENVLGKQQNQKGY